MRFSINLVLQNVIVYISINQRTLLIPSYCSIFLKEFYETLNERGHENAIQTASEGMKAFETRGTSYFMLTWGNMSASSFGTSSIQVLNYEEKNIYFSVSMLQLGKGLYNVYGKVTVGTRSWAE